MENMSSLKLDVYLRFRRSDQRVVTETFLRECRTYSISHYTQKDSYEADKSGPSELSRLREDHRDDVFEQVCHVLHTKLQAHAIDVGVETSRQLG